MTSQTSKKLSNEPHLYVTRDTPDLLYLNYRGIPKVSCRIGRRHLIGFRSNNTLCLLALVHFVGIEITPESLIFKSSIDNNEYVIPHTPKTFQEWTGIVEEYGHLLRKEK